MLLGGALKDPSDIRREICALWVDKVQNVQRLRRMDRSHALFRAEMEAGVKVLVSDVLWDGQRAVALLDGVRVQKLLTHIQARAARDRNQENRRDRKVA